MQWPPTNPGEKFKKFHLVDASFSVSEDRMFNLLQIIEISFTNRLYKILNSWQATVEPWDSQNLGQDPFASICWLNSSCPGKFWTENQKYTILKPKMIIN